MSGNISGGGDAQGADSAHGVLRVRLAGLLATQVGLSGSLGLLLGAYTVLAYVRGHPEPIAVYVLALPTICLLVGAGTFVVLHRRVSRRQPAATAILLVETAAILLATVGTATVLWASNGAAPAIRWSSLSPVMMAAAVFDLSGVLAVVAALRLEPG